jgi:hypothetical protein
MTKQKYYLEEINYYYLIEDIEDVYLNMIENGKWFENDDTPIDSVSYISYTYDEEEYNYIKQLCEALDWYNTYKNDLIEIWGGSIINEVNDYITVYNSYKNIYK